MHTDIYSCTYAQMREIVKANELFFMSALYYEYVYAMAHNNNGISNLHSAYILCMCFIRMFVYYVQRQKISELLGVEKKRR